MLKLMIQNIKKHSVFRQIFLQSDGEGMLGTYIFGGNIGKFLPYGGLHSSRPLVFLKYPLNELP